MKAPYLKWISAEGRDHVFCLEGSEILLGRKSDATITLSDPYISRHHAKLTRTQDGYTLVDLGSTHGTSVNGKRITERALSGGDRISLGKGRVELTYVEGSGVAGPGSTQEDTTSDSGDNKSIMDLTSVLPSLYSSYSDLEKISLLLDLQYNWGKSFSAQKTFQQILVSALKISGAERGFVLLRKEEGFEYVVGMDGTGRTMSQSEFIQTSQSVVRRVTNSGEPVFMTEGIAGDFANQDSILAMNLRAIACIPLKWISSDADGSDVRGILYLDSTKTMHALSGLDQKILDKLALEAVNVFEKLEMIETLQEKELFEQELALARETQQSLLPHSIPELDSFEIFAFSQPTRSVGGDFYDFPNSRSGELTVVLADVSGKGISAALLSSLLQGAIDMEVRTGVEPGEALTRINKLLCRRSQSNRFVTLFLFRLNREGEGDYISAGHNPVFLFRAASGLVETLESKHMIAGAFDFATYATTPLQLKGGDVLVVYSDGLTDAENAAGDMFGESRLMELVEQEASGGAEHLEMAILQAIEEFTQGRAQTDDITFVLVQKK
ncbi:MAG: SpoIIE family protein phosphatase [Acidobacteriota bacterium]